ncbi:helix-turn-helix domain-containing protein [Eupransor demetentiae]|uniref:Contains Zn-binding and two AraC-type DNA-binding domains (AdaA) n=1 Tax=Eupransor demetentiae TaxID=3109584 RepID=A0ABP0ERZ8_9LACO|nr:Methylphosphotriester-DNA--protein-cysteine methyltransferase (N-terminal fragment of Ada) [Lactobacillaceae bacterium LMG 33000]
MYSLTKKRWDAIIHSNQAADGTFIYGVDTDGRVCKPSCTYEKDFNKSDVEIFKDEDEALMNGFHPCPDCKPFGLLEGRDQLVIKIKSYLAEHYGQRITLDQLSEHFQISPGILHRAFMQESGESPQNYLLKVRLYHAKEMLKKENTSTALIGLKVGIPNLSYFNTVFKQYYGQTAAQYRKANSK